MHEPVDVLIGGTGLYAQKIAVALGMTSPQPLTVAIAGRDRKRMAWLARSTNARAFLFERQVRAFPHAIRWESAEAIAESLTVLRPRLVVQAASVQSPRALDGSDTPWARMIRAAGGFGVTVVLQALLVSRMARAQAMSGVGGFLLNACYPDMANRVVALQDLAIHCGSGNISSIAAILSSELGFREAGRLRMLYQHQSPTDWRKPVADRRGIPPRVWIDDEEMTDVYKRFADVIMPVDPGQSIAGTTTVPMIYACLGWCDYRGHAPGPNGLPGGYPITIRDGVVALDLPPSLSAEAAAAWYQGFADHEPAWVSTDGRISHSDGARRAFDAYGVGHLGEARVTVAGGNRRRVA